MGTMKANNNEIWLQSTVQKNKSVC